MLSFVHTLFGFSSLIFGVFVIAQVKGTKKHRYIGRLYVVSMLLLCATSFGLFNLFGGFGVFHFAALVSLTCIAGGMGAVFFRKKISDWLVWHYQFMSWSFLGLLGATSNEAFVHVAPLAKLAHQYQYVPLVALVILFAVGGVYINMSMSRLVANKYRRFNTSK